MEQLKQERAAVIKVREISLADTGLINKIASLITEHSWFEGYPINPLDELEKSDHIVGAYEGDTLAGFATINKVASPDGQGNGEWWLADVVVLPEYRKRGIYTNMYTECMRWLADKPGRIFSCTENQIMDDFFIRHGWNKIRDTKDESGGDCRVYEFERSEQAV